jgi:hypothetical protein
MPHPVERLKLGAHSSQIEHVLGEPSFSPYRISRPITDSLITDYWSFAAATPDSWNRLPARCFPVLPGGNSQASTKMPG